MVRKIETWAKIPRIGQKIEGDDPGSSHGPDPPDKVRSDEARAPGDDPAIPCLTQSLLHVFSSHWCKRSPVISWPHNSRSGGG